MVNQNDIELMIEKIKDIFYEEVSIKFDEQSGISEIDEGLFFSRINESLKSFFDVNSKNNTIPIDRKLIELEDLFEHPCLSYSKVTYYINNRGRNWILPTISDFENLPVEVKKNFTNDLYWSSTPYDHYNYWAFSFKRNKKVIVNINHYCYVILKRC